MKSSVDLFDKAKKSLLDNKFDDFYFHIKSLFDKHITCDCFFWDLENEFIKLNDHISTIIDDSESFQINFAKGIIYRFSNDEMKSFNYLSKAVDLNPNCNIAYSLRASVSEILNKLDESVKDADKALGLQPSARNYFVLGNVLINKKIEDALLCYDQAISLNLAFACAYRQKGRVLAKIGEHKSAIKSFKMCLKIDKSQFCYIDLADSYLKVNDFKNAILITKKGIEIHPQKLNYKKFLNKIFEKLWLCAFELQDDSKRSNLVRAKKYYDLYIKTGGEISSYFARDYFNCELNLNAIINPQMDLILNNSKSEIYFKLVKLRSSAKEKKKSKIALSKDEYNSLKLMMYEGNDKFNFGKYNSHRILDIMNTDPEYIFWLIFNNLHFSISPEIFFCDSARSRKDYYLAISVNNTKLFIGDFLSIDLDYIFNRKEVSYDDWLDNEFGDDASTAFWNND